MKRYLIVIGAFSALLFACSSTSAGIPSYRQLILIPNRTSLMLVGDEAKIQTGPLHKNIKYVKCKVQGNAVVLIQKSGTPPSGYTFTFKAVKSGKAFILKKTSRLGKKGENVEVKEFRIRIYAISEIPKVRLSSIAKQPEKYTGGFVLITGTSRGWGFPEKARKVWGNMVTRSDWIIEDNSGAAYVSGIHPLEKGKIVNIICRVAVRHDGSWALIGQRILAGRKRINELKNITQGNNEFAIDLYKKVSRSNGNVFFSPFSISDALAMTYAGARGDTERQIAKVLHFTLPQKELHKAFSEFIKSLQVKPHEKAYQLCIANALWGQRGYGFLEEFKALIDRYYGGGFYETDFADHTEEARKRINAWVEQKTEKKIKDLITRGDIDSLTRLVLTNAIYFKGKWASQFEKKNTKPLPFHVSPQKIIKVPMMFQEGRFPYFENEILQVIELPYAGEELSMIILLPKSEGIENIEQHLTERNLNQWFSQMRETKVSVYLPKFKLKTKYYMAKLLAEMGMPNAFSNAADFSGMTGNKELKISKIIHQAYVDVNEEGTEAAAATAVVMRLKSVLKFHPIFKADHPFVFMIVHKKTESILFIGRIVNPIK